MFRLRLVIPTPAASSSFKKPTPTPAVLKTDSDSSWKHATPPTPTPQPCPLAPYGPTCVATFQRIVLTVKMIVIVMKLTFNSKHRLVTYTQKILNKLSRKTRKHQERVRGLCTQGLFVLLFAMWRHVTSPVLLNCLTNQLSALTTLCQWWLSRVVERMCDAPHSFFNSYAFIIIIILCSL